MIQLFKTTKKYEQQLFEIGLSMRRYHHIDGKDSLNYCIIYHLRQIINHKDQTLRNLLVLVIFSFSVN